MARRSACLYEARETCQGLLMKSDMSCMLLLGVVADTYTWTFSCPLSYCCKLGWRHGVQVRASSEYIGGLSLAADDQQLVVAGGDGGLSLLDVRKAGEKVNQVSCGGPLLCSQTDGQTAAAGAQNGQVTQMFYCLTQHAYTVLRAIVNAIMHPVRCC